MHLIYIDDSFEAPYQVYSAIAVPASSWRDTFSKVREWRRGLKKEHGIFIHKEFHATEFVAGRGRLGPQIVSKYHRAQIFRSAFDLLNGIDTVRIFNSCRTSNQDWAFERLITRIQKTMQTWDSHALLICDEGKEAEFTRLIRRMGVFNPVPVYVGPGQTQLQNIATIRILEDPFFKPSEKSYFVQLADFVAYGLLRREKRLASKEKYQIGDCFDLLGNVVVRLASLHDPMGVIR